MGILKKKLSMTQRSIVFYVDFIRLHARCDWIKTNDIRDIVHPVLILKEDGRTMVRYRETKSLGVLYDMEVNDFYEEYSPLLPSSIDYL